VVALPLDGAQLDALLCGWLGRAGTDQPGEREKGNSHGGWRLQEMNDSYESFSISP
jgi:hypothetical protein